MTKGKQLLNSEQSEVMEKGEESSKNGEEKQPKTETKKSTEKEAEKKTDWNTLLGETKNESLAKDSEIDDLLKDYKKASTVNANDLINDNKEDETSWQQKPKRRGRKSKKKTFISGEVLSGYLFLTLVDMLIPMGIATINNMVDKNNHVNFNDLRLKTSQLNELAPIADEVMKEIQLKANPTAILFISFISIYGLNFVNAKYGADG